MIEFLKIAIPLAALALAFSNFFRLNNLDLKGEYKDKRNLYQECLDEAKHLIDLINSGLADIQSSRDRLFIIKSPYLNSLGSKQGHDALISDLRAINTDKDNAEALYKGLDEVINLEDKEAFDKCIEVRSELKDIYLRVSPLLPKAKNLVERMIMFAESQPLDHA